MVRVLITVVFFWKVGADDTREVGGDEKRLVRLYPQSIITPELPTECEWGVRPYEPSLEVL